ncbi:hypothetical protein ED92_38595 [Amycolatopsis sp. MJM2582]|uniref:hypothetical protein n=1 Tax=Amycolatopsis sp. MJM2582 TaxID=1427749 RepID=UPI0005082623|nr:hypothetical protein [Amycolatopsis sp. MJM2582]KFZ77012.1 hypothetical protein ED92_38595 [Amycolatopsis sp. MJM2582]
METTADEVRSTFLASPEARHEYFGKWENNPRRIEHGVVSTMRNHVTKAIYSCTLDTFEWIKDNHEHPLKDIKKKDIAHISLAANWNPDFAFVHLFHLLMEDLGRPPLWSEFDRFAYGTGEGMKMFGAERAVRENKIFDQELARITAKSPTAKNPENRAKLLANGSLDWRIGNAYYGFMRDMYTAVALRERGLDVRVHPLADANFRIDGWIGHNILSVFVVNPRYKIADQQRADYHHMGRKRHVEELFPRSEFDFVALTMEGAHEHGKFHFPSKAAIDEVEQLLCHKG